MVQIIKASAAGLLLSVAAAPASAAVIVQTSSNSSAEQGGFDGFDRTLGTLNSVTLAISTTEHRALPFGTMALEQYGSISWVVEGYSNFYFSVVDPSIEFDPENPFPHYPDTAAGLFQVAISGSGTASLENIPDEILVTGSALFNIDPALVPQDVNFYGGETRIQFGGPGFYNFSDTTFSAPIFNGPYEGGYCGDRENPGRFGDEGCNNHVYTLTYNYTPAAEVGAVPEPTTWAMMLLGFGAIGFTMRRRRPALLANAA